MAAGIRPMPLFWSAYITLTGTTSASNSILILGGFIVMGFWISVQRAHIKGIFWVRLVDEKELPRQPAEARDIIKHSQATPLLG